jgi:hypothetical protein
LQDPRRPGLVGLGVSFAIGAVGTHVHVVVDLVVGETILKRCARCVGAALVG